MTVRLLLPAGGRAVRLGGILKELLPLGLRHSQGSVPVPALAWSIGTGMAAGAESAIVVTSASKAPILMESVFTLVPQLPISYVYQPRPEGLARALLRAMPHFRADDIVLMLMPDSIIHPASTVIDAVNAVREGAHVCAVLLRSPTPEQFGVARFDDHGRLVGFVEKPATAPSPWIWSAVAWRASFFQTIERYGFGEGTCLTPVLDVAVQQQCLETRRCESSGYWDVGTYGGYQAALRALGNLIPPSLGAAEPL